MDRAEHDLRPIDPAAPAEAAVLREVARLFVTGLSGGVLTLIGLALLCQARTHGATHALHLDRALRRECLERGVTPEQLAAERAAADARRASDG